jgi:Xaa-Pro dipeptidase
VIPNEGEIRRSRVVHASSRIAELRARFDGAPLVLSTSGAVAWATGALTIPIDRTAPTDPLWLVVTDAGATLVASSVEEVRTRSEGGLDDLGFDLVAAPWYQPTAALELAERVAGPRARWISDGVGGRDVSHELTAARLALGVAERQVLAWLADVATCALEGALRAWRPGESTDRQIAADVAGEVERQGADAVCLIVGGDERVRRFRHPLMSGAAPRELVMAVVVARGLGLHAAATRLAVARNDATLEARLAQVARIDESVRAATRPGATWGDAYHALGRAYAAEGESEAWREHFQGGPIGYAQREFELCPEGPVEPWFDVEIPEGAAVAWNPSLGGGAKIEDTYLLEKGRTVRQGVTTWPRAAGPDGGPGLWRAE